MIQHDTTNNMTWVCLKMALYTSFLLVLPLGDFRTLRVWTGDWKSTMAIKTCDDSLEDSTLRAAQHFDTKIYGPYPTCMCTWDMNGYVVGTASYIHPSWIWGKLFLKPLNQIITNSYDIMYIQSINQYIYIWALRYTPTIPNTTVVYWDYIDLEFPFAVDMCVCV